MDSMTNIDFPSFSGITTIPLKLKHSQDEEVFFAKGKWMLI